MRLVLAAIGKLKAGPDRDLFDRYWSRLEAAGRGVGITSIKFIELPESRADTVDSRKVDEAERLLKAVGAGGYLIALDETGKGLTSPAFAALVRKHCDSGAGSLAFLIGGPDGHGVEVAKRANLKLNLGTLTLPHGLARIVLAEQLYRAATILTGHPYHRN